MRKARHDPQYAHRSVLVRRYPRLTSNNRRDDRRVSTRPPSLKFRTLQASAGLESIGPRASLRFRAPTPQRTDRPLLFLLLPRQRPPHPAIRGTRAKARSFQCMRYVSLGSLPLHLSTSNNPLQEKLQQTTEIIWEQDSQPV